MLLAAAAATALKIVEHTNTTCPVSPTRDLALQDRDWLPGFRKLVACHPTSLPLKSPGLFLGSKESHQEAVEADGLHEQ